VYTWNWLPAVGTAGGILVGVKEDSFEVISWELFKYCVSVIIRDRRNGTVWRFVSVYGSSYDEFKLEFINELHNVMACWDGPTLIGGDFNLIRDSSEKNSGNINQHWANLFVDWSNRYDLIEIKNAGRLYTWANNQENLIMAAIDKVFVTTCWEQLFPAVSVRTLPRVGSDHTPLVFDSGAFIAPKLKQFRFEKWWLNIDGFHQVVTSTWNKPCRFTRALDIWQYKIRNLRKIIKGWAINREAEQNRIKKQLIAEYDVLDIMSETQILSPGAKEQMKKLQESCKKSGGMKK
jgi:hypothetical protein